MRTPTIDVAIAMDSLEPRRLFAAGDPIEAFGDAGTSTLSTAYGNVVPSQVLPLASGKLLIAVNSQYDRLNRWSGTFDRASVDLIRLNADGTSDPTFGTDGRGGVDVFFNANGSYGDTPRAQGVLTIRERGDGRIDAVGTSDGEFYLARFTAEGILDSTFGIAGRVRLQIGDPQIDERLPFIRIYDDAAVLAASNAGRVYRFNPDGSADDNFGVDGRVVLNSYSSGRFFNLTDADFGDDGSVYLSGRRSKSSGSQRNVILKLTPGGDIDTQFANGGEIDVGKSVFPHQLARVTDGWVALLWASRLGYNYTTGALRLMKFDDTGTLDADFGTAGIVQHEDYDSEPPTQVMVDGQDRIVTLSAYQGQGSRGSGRMARYDADGSADAQFGAVYWPTGSTVVLASAASDNSFAVATESRIMSLAIDGHSPGPVSVTRNGTLSLSGTTRAENMSIGERYTPTRDAHVLRWFAERDAWGRMIDPATVKRIVIDAGAGDDIVTAPLTRRPVTVIGARGNDRLFAGLRNTNLRAVIPADNVVLSGGDGDDSITFFGNSIAVEGGRGNDRIIGNFAGQSTAINLIRGGEGDDDILTTGPRGQHGFDLFGDAGRDTIVSGNSHDLLDGGEGLDLLAGDPTRDTLVSGER